MLRGGYAGLATYAAAVLVAALRELRYWSTWDLPLVQLWTAHDIASLPFQHLVVSLAALMLVATVALGAAVRWPQRAWYALGGAVLVLAGSWIATASSTASERASVCVEVTGVAELDGACHARLGRIGDSYVFLRDREPVIVDHARVHTLRRGRPASTE